MGSKTQELADTKRIYIQTLKKEVEMLKGVVKINIMQRNKLEKPESFKGR
jgi:hypothetical protein